MKTFKFLCLVIFVKIKFCKSLENEVTVIRAVLGIIDNDFAKTSQEVDFIYSGESEKLANNIVRRSSAVFKISKVDEKSSKIHLNTSSILLFDSVNSLQELNITWQTSKTVRHNHLVHFLKASIDDLKNSDGYSTDHVNFLMNSKCGKSIDLVTNFMFTPNQCHVNQLVTINRFIKSTMRWENSKFYPNKYENFHGCNLSVGVIKNSIQTLATTFKDGTIQVKGYSHDVVDALAKFYNFKMNYKLYEVVEEAVNKSEVDIFAITTIMEFSDDVITSHSYLYDFYSLFVPPGELYSSLEKMFIMFDAGLWIAITVTLFGSIVVIQIINFASTKIQNLVYGREVQTPTLNLVSIFLNGGQHKMPTQNFARFIAINFAFWTLVIRTCYQSELYKYLQKDIRKQEVQTINEMIQKGFTFYGDGAFVLDMKQTHCQQG